MGWLGDSIPATAESYLNLVCYCGTIAGIGIVDGELSAPMPRRARRRWMRSRAAFERRRDRIAAQLGLPPPH
jgi:hypothetical protein